ncbi:unnamed protein product [Sphenostylis stenocarpa]|uniref:Uncharacterized protein n=1 Tax=Sphenostylis stenocarpa TaxID=92480 RepID=A0AA86SUY0_9FABA|nr:unnamed protein product [Sphenostylis stenocarpa]
MAIARSHVPTCRVRNIQESYRYDYMELAMDQTKASKKGNKTFEYEDGPPPKTRNLKAHALLHLPDSVTR